MKDNRFLKAYDFLLDHISDDLKHYLARENMFVLRIVSLIVTVLEGWLLAATLLFIRVPEVLRWNAISLGFCSLVSGVTWFVTRHYLRTGQTGLTIPKIVIVAYYILLVLWSMNVSYRNYRGGFQMLTFYVVQFCFASFTIFPPLLSLALYTLTFGFFHYALVFYDGGVQMNPMNYFALGMMTVIASWIYYNIAVRSYQKTVETNRLNEVLASMSRQDDLTGLKNRHALRMDAFRYIDQDLIVMMADLDEFKQFNDTYGHAIGDRVLEAYSRFLTKSFGEDNVYRFGGDEFLVVMHAREKAQFEAGISRWAEGMSAIKVEGREDLRINGSGGYTYGKGHTEDELKALIRRADEALYEAKNSGKNKVVAHK